jgi:hypothetical protein
MEADGFKYPCRFTTIHGAHRLARQKQKKKDIGKPKRQG